MAKPKLNRNELVLKCVCCSLEEKINIDTETFDDEEIQSLQDAINNKGWKLTKVSESEGYCCKKCGG